MKGSFGKSPFNVFNDIKGSIKGRDAGRLSALHGDRRQSASGLKVAEESFPGELGNALAMLEKMKCGRKVWRQGNRRPVRVLIHCYGGINRTCAAYCALVILYLSLFVFICLKFADPVEQTL